jgi:hypothetical protein
LGLEELVLEISEAQFAHDGHDDGVNDEMQKLQNVFALVGVDEELVDWHVVPEVPSWIVARALDAGDLGVISLSADELPSLIDICEGVRTKPPERHPKRGHLKGHVEQKHKP